MRKEYDFSDATRGPAIAQPGKTRIAITLDADIVAAFRARASGTGRGYQTAINRALRENLANGESEHSRTDGVESTPQSPAAALRKDIRLATLILVVVVLSAFGFMKVFIEFY